MKIRYTKEILDNGNYLVTLYLPCYGICHTLHYLLMDFNRVVFDQNLSGYWGNPITIQGIEYRKKEIELKPQEILMYMRNTIELLKNIKEKNTKNMVDEYVVEI